MPFKNPFRPNDPDASISEGATPANPEASPTPEKTPAELIAESLKPITDGFGTVNTTLTAIDARLKAVEDATKRPTKPAENSGPQRVSVFDDEDAFAAQTVAPVMLRQYELEARMSRDSVRRDYEAAGYAEVWKTFETEINQTLDNTPLVKQNASTGQWEAWRGDPKYISNVVNMIIGAAAVKAGLKFGGKDRGFFLESGDGASGDQSARPLGDGLTPDQRKVFNRMKGPDGKPISADAIKATLGKLKFVN